jgi:predicted solute-binding protein
MLRQADLVCTLPEFKVDTPLSASADRPERAGVLWSLWNFRVSLPLPLAALVLVLFVGSVLMTIYAKAVPSATTADQQAAKIQYVQIERLEPVSAVLVEHEEGQDLPKKESL